MPYLRIGSFQVYLGRSTLHRGTCIVSRLPHVGLDDDTPYHRLSWEGATLPHLRVIEMRALIHHERHLMKLEDRAWEGRLKGYSKDTEDTAYSKRKQGRACILRRDSGCDSAS